MAPSTVSGNAYEGTPDGMVLGSKPGLRQPPKVEKPDDFGFSGIVIDDAPVEKSPEEILTSENISLKASITKYKVAMKNITGLIMNLLDNLSKNPEKDMILWKGEARMKAISDAKLKISEWNKGLI